MIFLADGFPTTISVRALAFDPNLNGLLLEKTPVLLAKTRISALKKLLCYVSEFQSFKKHNLLTISLPPSEPSHFFFMHLLP